MVDNDKVEKRKINIYYPTKAHKAQQIIINDPARFKVIVAGRKFRKTSLIVSELMRGAMTTPLEYPYIGPSKVMAKNMIWNDHVPRLLNHFKEVGYPYKKRDEDLSVFFPNSGGTFKIYGVDSKDSLRGMSTWGGVGCDEYQDWDEDIWGLIIRPNLSVHRAWAYISGTPKGLNILYDMWERGNPHSKNKMKDFKSFRFTSYDNPDLSTDELEAMRLEYLSQGGEDYFKQEMMAEFIKAKGAVYKEWDFTTKFVDLKYDPNLPLHISFDFGVNDPTSVLWIQPMGSEVRIIDYYEATDASIEHYISVINSKPYKKAELYTGDIAGYSRTLTTGTSPIEILNQKGIYLRTKSGVRIPDQIRATHAIMNRLYVKNTLNRVRDCLMNYRYPENKSLVKGNEIPLHDQYSHMARALEYWVINYANVIGTNYTPPEPSWANRGGRKKMYG